MMESKKYINSRLFNASGCLQPDALKAYATGKLTEKEALMVKDHAATCAFCKDAIEGYEHVQDQAKIETTLNEINANVQALLSAQQNTAGTQKIHKNRTWALTGIAASFIVVGGLFFLLHNQHKDFDKIIASHSSTFDEQAEKGFPRYGEQMQPPQPQSDVSETPQAIQDKKNYPDNKTQQQQLTDKEEQGGAPPQERKDENAQQKAVAEKPLNKAKKAPLQVSSDDTEENQAQLKAEQSESPKMTPAEGGANAPNDLAFSEEAEKKETTSSKKRKTSRNQRQRSTVMSKPKLSANPYEYQVYTNVDRMPTFFNQRAEVFIKFIEEHINYPHEALNQVIEGTVIVRFAVNKEGQVVEEKVIKGVHPTLDREALRVVKHSPKWKPGTKNGKPVKVYFAFPVHFVMRD